MSSAILNTLECSVYNYNFTHCDDGHKWTSICQNKDNVNGLAKGFKAILVSQASSYCESTKQKLVFLCANRLLMWKLEKLLVPTVKVSSVSEVHSL